MYKYIISSILIFVFVLSSCKKTEEDKDNEKKIIGTWLSVIEYSVVSDSIYYYFEEDNNGMTNNKSDSDDFSWEIKRGDVYTYYKKSPNYQIGYDKYNSKGIYRIISIEDSTMQLLQNLYGGLQRTLNLKRQ